MNASPRNTAAPRVNPRGRRERMHRAEQYELAGFPASAARYHMLKALTHIQTHMHSIGTDAALNEAIKALGAAADCIDEWREADMARCEYPYKAGLA
jgi:hypothetical protein